MFATLLLFFRKFFIYEFWNKNKQYPEAWASSITNEEQSKMKQWREISDN